MRRHVVAAVERHALDDARGDRQPVDLRRAAAIRREQQRPAVRRERGLGVDARRVEQPLHAGAVGVDQEDLRAAVLGERHREPAAVRRPRGRAVAAAEIGEHLPLPGRHRLHVDDRLLVLHRHVGDPRAVGRPRGRQQRLVRADDRLRIAAVGIGDDQLEAVALLRDVRDARREHAGVAGELLVDDVGDPVRGGAELRRRDDVGHRGELRLLDGVDEREADFHAAVLKRPHRPDHDGVRAARAEVGHLHVLGAARPRHDAGVAHLPEEAAPRADRRRRRRRCRAARSTRSRTGRSRSGPSCRPRRRFRW